MTTNEKYNTILQYKGFTIYFIHGEWFAGAYANPGFYNTNLSKLKKEINKYLSQRSLYFNR